MLRVDQAWPFPYLMFGSSDNSGTVAFQNDRLVRSWRFTDGNPYPGFEQLSSDLSSRLDQFADVVRQETEQQLSVVGAECHYQNRLDDSLGSSSLLGFLTGWRADLPEVALKTRYSGLRLHMCDDDELDGCGLWVSVDVDEDGVNLMMNTETEGSVESERLGGLDKAHDLLIKKFVEITSEEMHQQWGKQA